MCEWQSQRGSCFANLEKCLRHRKPTFDPTSLYRRQFKINLIYLRLRGGVRCSSIKPYIIC
jgi:hypothetical protein